MGQPTRNRLALVVIAKDEARTIARCLRSAKPWVDTLIVLDTGSTDATAAIARECGAKVYPFQWVDDFSAARNAALAHSDADWNLVLDADEWIADGAQCLGAQALGPPEFVGVVSVASTFDTPTGRSRAVNWIPRLLPRGTRYVGRVHEQPVSALPRKRLPLEIGHDGYERQALQAKRGRNAALLLAELATAPDNPYTLYQLGKDCEIYGEFDSACDYYARAWSLMDASAAYAHGLLLRQMYCLGQSGRLEDAIALGSSNMDNWNHSPDFFFVMGNLLLDLAIAQPQRAMDELLPLAQSCWERCLEIGEAPWLDDSVQGRGSHLAAHNLDIVRKGMLGALPPAA